MRAPEHGRCVALVVLAEKLDVRSKAELGDERRRVDDDPPGDKEASAGMRLESVAS